MRRRTTQLVVQLDLVELDCRKHGVAFFVRLGWCRGEDPGGWGGGEPLEVGGDPRGLAGGGGGEGRARGRGGVVSRSNEISIQE